MVPVLLRRTGVRRGLDPHVAVREDDMVVNPEEADQGSVNYVPILKGKEGEFEGMKALTPKTARAVVPLVEVEPVPKSWNRREKTWKYAISLDGHAQRWAGRYVGAWGGRTAFIDVDVLGDEVDPQSGRHCIDLVFGAVAALGGNPIPVVRLTSSKAQVAAIRKAHTVGESGVCVRVTDAQANSPTFPRAIGALLKAAGARVDSSDLVIESGTVEAGQVKRLVARWTSAVTVAAGVGAWRSLTVAASSFPVVSGHVGVHEFPRVEAAAWARLVRGALPRKPDFGDFGVQGPEWPDSSSPPWGGNACIRYTVKRKWVISRGAKVKGAGKLGPLYQSLASDLAKHAQFRGAGHSWGDDWIADCASRTRSTADASKWRGIGANQHITFVTKRLATQGAP